MSLRGAIATKQSQTFPRKRGARVNANWIPAPSTGFDKLTTGSLRAGFAGMTKVTPKRRDPSHALRTTRSDCRATLAIKKRGFTLIELLVAMAVLALMMAFASMVFKVSIDTYRVSMATAEIMQKLRAVTDQLDADFKGLRKDALLLIWFRQQDSNDPTRYDQIMFFADGDFSSIQLYTHVLNTGHPDLDNGNTVVRGNVARVFYGQANASAIERNRILARRQHILTDDADVESWPNISLNDLGVQALDPEPQNAQTKEDRYEHDRLSLSEWKSIDGANYVGGNSVIDPNGHGFSNQPIISTANPRTFHKLFCECVNNFTIQWAYWDTLNSESRFYWFPSDDPDGNGSDSDTDFSGTLGNEFGVCFNVVNLSATHWHAIGSIAARYRENNSRFFPKAIKFTFRLYDSKGVIRDGMLFSHIVYLEQ